MGIVEVSITDEIPQYYNLPPKGVLIMRIASYGPTDRVSLIIGDVIVAIDGWGECTTWKMCRRYT